ncbi:MAG: serine hydrolase [Spirochaetes bacterium]|nr:serine hydrolase [Spirochaetota bacterium]
MKTEPIRFPLPRALPEEVGIPSQAVTSFIDALAQAGQEIHSFMLLRHGRVAAEGWWKPYESTLPHQLFSLSKSFTSTAVGFAVTEGRLSVDDPVLPFFPEATPKRPSANLQAMRVRHLLTMSTGHAKDTVERIHRLGTRDWVKAILAFPVDEEPGSRFVYNSGASYLLSAIVQKATGQRLLTYLTPRLFAPLGIEGATWETCPRGVDTGGWGLSLRTEDIAKFGQLLLAKGRWEGKQVIAESWVEEATRSQMGNDRPGEPIDWTQGYGYQFWRSRHGSFRGDGAFGQLCVVMPDQDAVLAMTSGAQSMQAILDAAWQTLLPAMGEAPKVVKKHQADLRRALRGLRLDPPGFRDDPPAAAHLDGTAWRLEANEAGLRGISFALHAGRLVVTIQARRKTVLRCGAGKWVSGRMRRERTGPAVPVRAAYTWTGGGALEATVRSITTPFMETYVCRFSGGALELVVRSNVSFGPLETPPIRGSRA